MQQLKGTPVRSHPQRKVHISNDLTTCTHVFVRCDAVRKPLQSPYDGPYERSDKYFVVDVKGKRDTISLDRLKPAHLDTDQTNADAATTSSASHTTTKPSPITPTTNTPQPPTRVTRSGRCVHYSVRFSV